MTITTSLLLTTLFLSGVVIWQYVRTWKGASVKDTDSLAEQLKQLALTLDPMDEEAGAFLQLARSLTTPGYLRDQAVVNAFIRLIEGHVRLQEQLTSGQQQLSAQARQMDSHVTEARTDALTQVANRRAFDDFLIEAAEKHNADGQNCLMMLVDVDYFKKCNDTYGHHAGDEVLRQVAAILKHHADGRALVARYGGEEFAIIASGLPRLTMCQMAENLRSLVACGHSL